MQQRIRRFSRLLKLREDDRRTEQAILAEERREEDEVTRNLNVLGREKSTAMSEFCGNADKIFSCQEIWFQRQAIEAIEKRIVKNNENLRDVQQRIFRTEERLVERHRDVKVMEGYVERLKENARDELFASEQLELDDIGMLRYGHLLKDSSR